MNFSLSGASTRVEHLGKQTEIELKTLTPDERRDCNNSYSFAAHPLCVREVHTFAAAKAPVPRDEQKGCAMYESKATLEYPFGEITIKVGVNGNADRPNQVVTHMLSTAAIVTGSEVVQRGLSDSQRSDSTQQQESYQAEATFGGITVSAEVGFQLKRRESKRTLNSMVFGFILPKTWETAALYFGDNQSLTTPQAPLAQRPQSDIIASIDDVIGLPSASSSRSPFVQPYGYGPLLDEPGQHPRRPALQH